jgi:alpha-tubulin suppressor-like RCC1 family protein
LGIGSLINKTTPTRVGTDNDWAKISAGQIHTLCLKSNGTLWAWGSNFSGQLGLGNNLDSNAPIQVGSDSDWQDIAAGGAHSLAIKNNGTLWACGINSTGQLGTGNLLDVNTFEQIGSDSWLSISAGYQYSVAIKTDNSLWTWGYNGLGQLGLDNNIDANIPTQVGSAINWTKIVAGSAFAFAINDQDELFGWGYNGFGNLGVSSPSQILAPIIIETEAKIVSAADGFYFNGSIYGFHSMLIKNSNQKIICTSGSNYVSQLGNGSTNQLDFFDCNTANIDNASIYEISNLNVSVNPNPFIGSITIDLHEVNEKRR